MRMCGAESVLEIDCLRRYPAVAMTWVLPENERLLTTETDQNCRLEVAPCDCYAKFPEHLVPIGFQRAALHVDIALPWDQTHFQRHTI